MRVAVELDEREKLWKSSWSFFHPGPAAADVVQWHFVPTRLEIVSNLTGITDEWQPVTAERAAERGAAAPWVLLPRRSAGGT